MLTAVQEPATDEGRDVHASWETERTVTCRRNGSSASGSVAVCEDARRQACRGLNLDLTQRLTEHVHRPAQTLRTRPSLLPHANVRGVVVEA